LIEEAKGKAIFRHDRDRDHFPDLLAELPEPSEGSCRALHPLIPETIVK
jgi:hypothetical protein